VTRALTRFRTLQGAGLWRPDPATQRRDVAVSLGAASLTLRDSRSGAVLAHWALGALRRMNPGGMPALYRLAGTGDAEGESLETDDTLLIEGLEAVLAALNPPPRGRWLRWGVLAAGLALVVGGLLALPHALVQRAAAIAPDAMRGQIGREALDLLTRPGAAGRLCSDASGRQVLTLLRNRVLGPDWRVLVIEGISGFEAAHLPGRIVLLERALVERVDSPEALAGWLLVQEVNHRDRDPMLDVLRHAGTRATLGMLTSGTLPEGALSGYAEGRLARPPVWPDAGAVAARMQALGLGFAPFVASLPPSAARMAAVLAAGPETGAALLTDGEWITLQAVCHG
jgi:hypothetical protein